MRRRQPLLQRQSQLAAVDGAIAEVAAGSGGALLIEGPAGIGKTAVLEEAAARAADRGVAVHTAIGDDLAMGFAYGTLSQLLLPALSVVTPEALAVLEDAPTAPAVRVLRGLPAFEPSADDASDATVAYGLYWLLAALGDAQPRLLCIDDAHWADGASLRTLAIVARRLVDLPVLIALAARPDPPASVADVLTRLGDRRVVLEPLDEAAVTTLVRRDLGHAADDKVVHELWSATGGNPFLVRELVAALGSRNWTGIDNEAVELERVAPASIRRFVLRRVAAAGPDAQRLARATAVLGDADLCDAARLAELSEGAAAAAADRLAAADVLQPGGRVRFVHPILRDVVRADIPAAHRGLAHARAARILADAGAAPEPVAAHLMESFPRRDPWVADALADAARRARGRGAPEAAQPMLVRALAEPPAPTARSEIAVELGLVQAILGQSDAIPTLERAVEWAVDPSQRALALVALARALFMVLDTGRALGLLDELTRDVGNVEPEFALRFAGELLGSIRLHPETRAEALLRLDHLRERALPPRASTVALLANLTLSAVERNETPEQVAELARLALTGGWLLEQHSNQLAYVVNALVWVDRIDHAESILDDAFAWARRSGSLALATMAYTVRSRATLRRGAVADAEEDARLADELAHEHGWVGVLPFTRSHLADALMQRHALDAAGQVLARAAAAPTALDVPDFLDSLGRLRLLQSAPDAALEHFLACGRQLAQRGGVDAPGIVPWRSHAAVALVALGDRARALQLASDELELARTSASAGAVGVAEMAAGLASSGDEARTHLEAAVAALTRSPRALASIEARLELGSFIRRQGGKEAARPHLRRALDDAHRHGAVMLAERAWRELLVAGARPRRAALTGLEALTPSERRVAELVVSGLTNRQIAQQLYVSMRTVATHLTHVYQRLGIRGRDELPTALTRRTYDPHYDASAEALAHDGPDR